MATNLTPQQLAELQQQMGIGAFAPGITKIGDRSYQKAYTSGESAGSDGPYGYLGFDTASGMGPGKTFSNYDLNGSWTGDSVGDSDNVGADFLKFAAIAGALGGGLYGLGFGGTGAAGAGGMTNGAFLGEAPWTATGGGALDFGAAGGAAGGTSAMGAGAGTYGTMAPIEQMAVPSSISAAGSLSPMEIAGTGLLSPAVKTALGVGSTLLGAAAGAQGQKGESTSTRDIPEWLKPYVTKQLDYTSSLLDKQMAPGYMQGYDDMRTKGMGLLSQPSMGNGFNRFFPGVK